uniref:Origin recognition complex subunit 1 n=1 Tax=Amphiprion percula TaxID=161767 RepID=A0A3P8SA44_AMPPE
MKYFTRPRVKREYRWRGKPLSFNRKLKTYDYGSLVISVEGLPRPTIIIPEQHILIEGDDEDNPYVAKVIRLFGDESGKQMKAVVQWFVRVSEVPLSKLKLLGREPHPQEIFYYQGRICDDEVNVESILRPVQVKHLDSATPFPNSDDKDTMYVKLSWDSKAFRVVDSALVESACEPASPSSQLPHAVSGVETESLHSATKLSASKCLSTKRRNLSTRTPGVCKKLELHTPEKKSILGEDVVSQLLDKELDSKVMLAHRLSSSPPQPHPVTHRLTPINKAHRSPVTQGTIRLKPSTIALNRLPPSKMNRPLLSARENCTRATNPSQRKEPQTIKDEDPALDVIAEEDSKSSPVLLVAATLRSSQRKSALLVSSRIRKQLNLLDNQPDLNSDGEDEDEFVPSQKELNRCSEEDEDDGEEEAGLDSEEEILVKKGRGTTAVFRTPRSKQKTHSLTRTPRKNPNKKIMPGTPRTPHQATPSIPCRSLPTRQPANILEEARARLHVSSVPESLPCREQEFQDIYSFVESKIIDGTGGCMYISGVPGTGKTATVHEVMRCLQHAADVDEIPTFHFIEINGMKMTDPHQAYVQILQNLTGQKATPDHAAALLDKRFNNPAPRKQTTVLLVDELDLLWTRKQNVMYNLFDWPTQRHAHLVVLTIANTMDLPERIMINRVASRLGLTRMSFQPYSFKQLQQIIMSRLNKVKAFEEDALQLASRKVAALSGDARRCLDICRRATEICEHSTTNPSATGLVGMSHVMEALNEMFSSAYITAIKCASMQEQLFLRAVIAEFRRLGLEEASFQQVFVQHQALCRLEGLQPISVSEGLAVCRRLGACRLLLLEPSRLGVLQRVRLNVSQDDVLYALKAD